MPNSIIKLSLYELYWLLNMNKTPASWKRLRLSPFHYSCLNVDLSNGDKCTYLQIKLHQSRFSCGVNVMVWIIMSWTFSLLYFSFTYYFHIYTINFLSHCVCVYMCTYTVCTVCMKAFVSNLTLTECKAETIQQGSEIECGSSVFIIFIFSCFLPPFY